MNDGERTQNSEIPLADMIESLRDELESAQRTGMDRGIAFGVEKVELELKVVLSRKLKAGGGIKFWVVSAEGSGERGNEATHTFKLTLSPLDADTKNRLEVYGKAEVSPDRNR